MQFEYSKSFELHIEKNGTINFAIDANENFLSKNNAFNNFSQIFLRHFYAFDYIGKTKSSYP